MAIHMRRPAGRSIALFVAGLLLGIPAVALANHQFPDVPASHPFHSQITAIAKAGITGGFNDGTYRPSDAVTRQSMAAFMERGFGRVGLSMGGAPTTASIHVYPGAGLTFPAPVRKVTITVPGATNAFSPQQLVYLKGHVQFDTSMSTAKGCPCEFGAAIRELTEQMPSLMQHQTFQSSSTAEFDYSFDVEAIFVASPGPHTYELTVAIVSRNSTTSEASFALATPTSLSAMTFPFGPTGGSTP